ncbi:MAG: hypothetical protein WCT22_02875 [Patescibacteria group bacterium]
MRINNFKKVIVCFVILVAIYFAYRIIKKGEVYIPFICNNISKRQALDIVKKLPEVNKYLKSENNISESQISKATVSIDRENKNSLTVHVYSSESYDKKLNIPSHLATFNWYTLDKCSGKILCEFASYDKNGIIKVANNYPCD